MKTGEALEKIFGSITSPPKKAGMKFDDGKLRYTLVDVDAHREFVAVLTAGAVKYDKDNWRSVDQWLERYGDALMRHFEDFRAGRMLDKDTMLHHLAHLNCDVHFLLALSLKGDQRRLGDSFDARYKHALKVARQQRCERLGIHPDTGEVVPALRLAHARLVREKKPQKKK